MRKVWGKLRKNDGNLRRNEESGTPAHPGLGVVRHVAPFGVFEFLPTTQRFETNASTCDAICKNPLDVAKCKFKFWYIFSCFLTISSNFSKCCFATSNGFSQIALHICAPLCNNLARLEAFQACLKSHTDCSRCSCIWQIKVMLITGKNPNIQN